MNCSRARSSEASIQPRHLPSFCPLLRLATVLRAASSQSSAAATTSKTPSVSGDVMGSSAAASARAESSA